MEKEHFMSDALQLIKERISATKFDTTRKLSNEEIRELISYAIEAPSSYNIQNWRFIAITGQEEKERLKKVAYNQQQVVDAAVTFIVLGDLRGYEKLPEILRCSIELGILSQEAADVWVK